MRSSPPGLAVVGLVMSMAVAGAGVAAAFAYEEGPSYPRAWDPRVADLADFVEDERDLRFEHPVYVDFLDDAAFDELVTTDASTLADQDREDAQRFVGIYRALGLLSGDVDLVQALNDTNQAGILALYEFESKRVRVRGTEINAETRLTIVHELTHALQDQHFDLDRILEQEESGLATLRAVTEGDANRVAGAYAETLSEGDQAELAKLANSGIEDFAVGTADVPDVLVAFGSAPYLLGQAFVELVVGAGGLAGLDDAIRRPPTSDEHLLDPFRYLEDDEPIAVDPAELNDGDQAFETATFGALAWYLMLAERIDPAVALTAADGWGGDVYSAFERDGRTCVAIRFAGDRPSDADELSAALEQWVAAVPDGHSSVSNDAGLVRVDACDPGPGAVSTVTARSSRALLLPTIRAAFAGGLLGEGATTEDAECASRALIRGGSFDELTADDGAFLVDPAFQARALAAVGNCVG